MHLNRQTEDFLQIVLKSKIESEKSNFFTFNFTCCKVLYFKRLACKKKIET